MLGNAKEFCSDWYAPDYYKQSPIDDPTGPLQPSARVLRGGGWFSYPSASGGRGRMNVAVSSRDGFRVVSESPAGTAPWRRAPPGETAGGTGGLPTGPTQAAVGGTPKIDPSRYVDIQLITSCSGPRGEIFDGAWWAVAGPKSTIKPPVPMSSGGYLGTAAHVTGTRAGVIEEYAKFGINMRRGGQGLFDASRYDGISFYARADKPMEIQVWMGQENTEPSCGLCAAMKTCYNSPKLAVTIGSVWSRFVVPFDALLSDPVPGGGRVPVTPATITQFGFTMPPGAFDFWIDEIYFVQGVEKVPGAARSIEGKPPGPPAASAAEGPARTPQEKPPAPTAAPERIPPRDQHASLRTSAAPRGPWRATTSSKGIQEAAVSSLATGAGPTTT